MTNYDESWRNLQTLQALNYKSTPKQPLPFLQMRFVVLSDKNISNCTNPLGSKIENISSG